ncbi:MAG: ferredoxin--NADP reductase [Flavobacteriaceae bacterium]|nr:ferredoxin--NADP reductase [Flavobacteriaceae bacterium]
MSAYHSLIVADIERLTPSSVAISLTIPEDLKKEFAYSAGQYLSLEASINGEAIRRSYSLSSAPHQNKAIVGIKKIEGGKFSTYANDVLKAGDKLQVAPPEGRFVFLPSDKQQHLLLFAAGSGITPLFSILKSALEETKNTSVQLVYGNKSPEESMFKSDLEALATAYPDRLSIHWIYSQSNEANALFGRIDASTVLYALNQGETAPTAAYLCGPEAMIHLVKETLVEKEIAVDKIHFELFTSSASAVNVPSAAASGAVQLTITADDATHTVETTSDKTILDAALQQKIDVPYSCQGGVCCSCIAKVTEGSASMENNQILTDDEVAEGLVLTCQAIPTSATLCVDYDDV